MGEASAGAWAGAACRPAPGGSQWATGPPRCRGGNADAAKAGECEVWTDWIAGPCLLCPTCTQQLPHANRPAPLRLAPLPLAAPKAATRFPVPAMPQPPSRYDVVMASLRQRGLLNHEREGAASAVAAAAAAPAAAPAPAAAYTMPLPPSAAPAVADAAFTAVPPPGRKWWQFPERRAAARRGWTRAKANKKRARQLKTAKEARERAQRKAHRLVVAAREGQQAAGPKQPAAAERRVGQRLQAVAPQLATCCITAILLAVFMAGAAQPTWAPLSASPAPVPSVGFAAVAQLSTGQVRHPILATGIAALAFAVLAAVARQLTPRWFVNLRLDHRVVLRPGAPWLSAASRVMPVWLCGHVAALTLAVRSSPTPDMRSRHLWK